jgi:hypothetical protein
MTRGPAGENPGVPGIFSFVHELPLMARPVIWFVLAALHLFDAHTLFVSAPPGVSGHVGVAVGPSCWQAQAGADR